MPDRHSAGRSVPTSPLPPCRTGGFIPTDEEITDVLGSGWESYEDPLGRASLHRTILTFAEAIAATPSDRPARRQPRSALRKPPIVTERSVLIDALIAAADMLSTCDDKGWADRG